MRVPQPSGFKDLDSCTHIGMVCHQELTAGSVSMYVSKKKGGQIKTERKEKFYAILFLVFLLYFFILHNASIVKP